MDQRIGRRALDQKCDADHHRGTGVAQRVEGGGDQFKRGEAGQAEA